MPDGPDRLAWDLWLESNAIRHQSEHRAYKLALKGFSLAKDSENWVLLGNLGLTTTGCGILCRQLLHLPEITSYMMQKPAFCVGFGLRARGILRLHLGETDGLQDLLLAREHSTADEIIVLICKIAYLAAINGRSEIAQAELLRIGTTPQKLGHLNCMWVAGLARASLAIHNQEVESAIRILESLVCAEAEATDATISVYALETLAGLYKGLNRPIDSENNWQRAQNLRKIIGMQYSKWDKRRVRKYLNSLASPVQN
jgi:hypothetical protein